MLEIIRISPLIEIFCCFPNSFSFFAKLLIYLRTAPTLKNPSIFHPKTNYMTACYVYKTCEKFVTNRDIHHRGEKKRFHYYTKKEKSIHKFYNFKKVNSPITSFKQSSNIWNYIVNKTISTLLSNFQHKFLPPHKIHFKIWWNLPQ